MLSSKHKFLFAHVPKTAGNSVQAALAPYSDDVIVRVATHQDGRERFEVRSRIYPTAKHSTLAEYRAAYGEAMLKGLYKFLCVRNPWSRALSHYFSPHRGPVVWNNSAFIDFVNGYVHPLRYYIGLSQNEWNLGHSLRNVDFVMRYETLQQDFDAVCRHVGLPQLQLPLRNKSGTSATVKYYDEQTRNFVATKFRDEIQHFGYDFPPGL